MFRLISETTCPLKSLAAFLASRPTTTLSALSNHTTDGVVSSLVSGFLITVGRPEEST